MYMAHPTYYYASTHLFALFDRDRDILFVEK